MYLLVGILIQELHSPYALIFEYAIQRDFVLHCCKYNQRCKYDLPTTQIYCPYVGLYDTMLVSVFLAKKAPYQIKIDKSEIRTMTET